MSEIELNVTTSQIPYDEGNITIDEVEIKAGGDSRYLANTTYEKEFARHPDGFLIDIELMPSFGSVRVNFEVSSSSVEDGYEWDCFPAPGEYFSDEIAEKWLNENDVEILF